MIRRLAGMAVVALVVGCGGDDDDPTGLTDLADVAGRSFELVGIGTIGGYTDIVPGTLFTGRCPGQPDLREETEFREAELSFSDDTYVLEMRVRKHCYDPEAEVVIPDWGPIVTEQISAGWSLDDDRLLLGSTSTETVYGYLHEGGLRVEFEPHSGSVELGNVLFFE